MGNANALGAHASSDIGKNYLQSTTLLAKNGNDERPPGAIVGGVE
jgi:hypothetical protein